MIRMTHRLKSFESVLDEERRDILALLEATNTTLHPNSIRPEIDPRSPIQPVRSMLEFDQPVPSAKIPTAATESKEKHQCRGTPIRSMLDVSPGTPPVKNTTSLPELFSEKYLTTSYRSMLDVTTANSTFKSLSIDSGSKLSPSTPPVRSMLDVSPTPSSDLFSSHNMKSIIPRSPSNCSILDLSPTAMFSPSSVDKKFKPQASQTGRTNRSSSLTAHKNIFHSKPSLSTLKTETESRDALSSCPLHNTNKPFIPKRSTSEGKNVSKSAIMTDTLSSENCHKDNEKRISNQKTSMRNTRNSHNRFSLNSIPIKNPDNMKITLTDGRFAAPKKLRRRVSDANLANSAGILSSLSVGKKRTQSSSDIIRNDWIAKEDLIKGIREDAILESSENSDADEDLQRGRKIKKESLPEIEKRKYIEQREKKLSDAQGHKKVVEEEHQETIKKLHHQESSTESLLEPVIVVTEPLKPLLPTRTSDDSPNNPSDKCNFEFNSPHDSETEAGMSDIQSAQKLVINTTPVISTPATGRCVRSIHRGDFAKMQQQARDNQRRVRKYLVAIDLSEEAAHALEWTIGTVLRDGDTLLAIYCVDEDVGITSNDCSSEDKMQEQIPAISNLNQISISSMPQSHRANVGKTNLTSDSTERSTPGRDSSKAEQDRHKAVQEITDRVTELLRRTKLQVKIVIEVIHCKSPKHLITEVIDYVSPTLVILGSRGRSALKGIILGSFSNYIVTKSSVPVMVARKRVRKHSKYKSVSIRLANNIENPQQNIDTRTLTSARVD
ncbi:putative universal stress protein [Golovinomyces cichoracearum]|uniref:Putative universal stress protein n=1 Tax=Golovinomyces cichoracearum TaxID=62708 RepID=A0A420J958_9PEZI|nr:putative universal stress protein [Golovinomyces cichoracearum]